MLEFTRRYRPGGMMTNYGPLPAGDQVEAAKTWIEHDVIPDPKAFESNGTDWDNYQMEARIFEILATAPTHPDHKSSRFFMTSDQIAIEFARRFEEDFQRMGRPIGGAGAGNMSLTKNIAGQLSRRIQMGTITKIEMQFLYHGDLKSLVYQNVNGEIVATPNEAGFPNSLFRLR
jgi:hypothetical protein